MPSPPVISARGLTKHYGARVGVEDVDLGVPEGCLFGFIGPNGAGKSTTIRLLMGFLRPGGGEASIFGHNSWRDSRVIKRDVGYVPGDLRLPSWVNGDRALRIVGAARGRDLVAAGRDLAEYFDLDLAVRVRSMSRGMRQKLGLILALVHEPRLLVLDEPTSALDPLTQERLYDKLRAVAARGGTVFFSSHVLSEVQDLCHRVAIVRDGRLIADEALETLRGRAMREVHIRWSAGASPDGADVPLCLELDERRPDEWRGGLSGTVPDLMAWLRDRPVADLSIEPPDLDSLFMRYYRDGAP